MSDISKEELKKEIAAILKDGDLSSITSKKVRQDIEKKLDIDLSSRRKEVDELVMDYIDKGKSKKNGNVEDDEEEEEEENEEEDEEDDEEEEEVKKPKRSNQKKSGGPPAKRYKSGSSDESEDASDGENDDEYSPKKKAAKKPAKRGAAGRKKKGGSDDDSDEDWGKGKKKGGGAKKPAAAGGAKRGGGGYTKPIKLSPELSALVGEEEMPRHEVVKRIWAIIKERNLYDPKNKQFAICDDELLKVFGVKRFRTFGMMKFLKNHFRTD